MTGIANPLLFDIPDQFEAARVILRVPRAGDGPAILDAVAESLDRLRPWFPFAQEEPDLDRFEGFARRSRIGFHERTSINLLLFRKSDGLLVGSSGFNQRLDWRVPRFEIGYWIRPALEGQGYISEAVRAETRIAFQVLQAERVEIRCDARNTRSATVAERCGYQAEARYRHYDRDVQGQLMDMLIYSLTRAGWEASRAAS
jgi:RimJ/RimL family protein N-acetyltransferase